MLRKKQLDGEPLLMLCVYTTHKFDVDEEKEERMYDATVEMLLDELKDADEEWVLHIVSRHRL